MTSKGFGNGSDKSARRSWVTPRVNRMRASDAAAGANPVVPEGPIALGS
ncbi:hypothetical protein J2Y54_000012 [Sphingomonas sp. BE123]|jgi:hypothetical protein|nr:hypothetical protein [Sphingomonas sp. BE123]MDR6850519.1 hypothetical protein [Sphingomonas sp. BE123]